MERFTLDVVRGELSAAQHFLTALGLHQSATWAGELLEDLGAPERATPPEPSAFDVAPDAYFLYGRDLLDEMDFDRASGAFKRSRSEFAQFLHFYAAYLALKKRASEKCLDPKKIKKLRPQPCSELEQKVRDAIAVEKDNPLMNYLLGLILIDQRQMQEAQHFLYTSLKEFPCHWGAWQALIQTMLFCERDDYEGWRLKEHWMAMFGRAAGFVALCLPAEALREIDRLEQHFCNSRYLMEIKGTLYHKLRNWTEAKQCFESLLQRDPQKLDFVHLYSDALLMTEGATEEIANLAASCAQIDKYRPETCVTMGNYYAHVRDHDKATANFERALKMDKNFYEAWTLLGHQLTESGNQNRATEAYGKALELNPRDYRPWYGLCQVMEREKNIPMAIQFAKRAVELNKGSDQLWVALGVLYDIDTARCPRIALKCFHKAAQCGNSHGEASRRLAETYQQLGDGREAVVWYKRFIETARQRPERCVEDLDYAVHWVAREALARRDFVEADHWCQQLAAIRGHERAAILNAEVQSAIQSADESMS